ncbi:hypothetical protein C8Q78DRAFT_963466, partial [Trametes maxima]
MGDVLHGLSHPPPQRHQGPPTAATALWGHLLRKTGSSQVPPSSTASSMTLSRHTPAISPFDKASASTRILLHDTQAHLEKFTERVTHLTTSLDDAKRELVLVQKLYQDDHERVVDRMIGLVNRCQTSLQKDIGTPAQSADVREVSQNLVNLSNRLESLDKKIDALNMLNQTQSQALQTMQDQQGQMLTALIPILPLLQVIPCHIDNARSQLKESVLELRQEIISRESMPAGPRAVLRKTPRPPASVMSGGSLCTPSDRKKRRLEAASD